MVIEKVKIKDLENDPDNLRVHSARNLDSIKISLEKFGQQKPIVVDAKGIVIAGNATLAAASSLGWKSINIVRTKLKDRLAVAYAIADNRTSELAQWDDAALAELLGSFDVDMQMLTGFDADEIAYRIAKEVPGPELSAAEEWDGMPSYTHTDMTSDSRLIVHFANKDDRIAFFKLIEQKGTSETKAIWYPETERANNVDKSYESVGNEK